MDFAVLYNIDKKKGVRAWHIKTVDDVIIISHGLVDGKSIETSEKISPKNVGRKNETSPSEQAIKEAKSRWKKKKDSGYREDLSVFRKNIKPMLAHEYKKHKNKVKYPVYIQPKLDGYRMIYDNGKLISRTGKEYEILYNTSLHKELESFGDNILDGELYVHDKDFDFEVYGILRKKKLVDGDLDTLNKIKYHVYDIMEETLTFEERNNIMKKLKNTDHVKIVPTIEIDDINILQKEHEKFIKDGYEGTMIRNKTGMYTHDRSTSLMKYKDFDDAEFKVVGFEKETDTKGDCAMPVVWVAETKDKKTFKIPSKGTREERTKLYENGESYIGKMLTVQFFGYTNLGIPRFPKTLRSGKSSFI